MCCLTVDKTSNKINRYTVVLKWLQIRNFLNNLTKTRVSQYSIIHVVYIFILRNRKICNVCFNSFM